MENEFNNIIALLEKINTHNANSIVPPAELDEEYDNVKDLDWLNRTAMEHLDLLKQSDPSSIDDIMGEICCLTVNLSTYFWHMESIRDITEKFIPKGRARD